MISFPRADHLGLLLSASHWVGNVDGQGGSADVQFAGDNLFDLRRMAEQRITLLKAPVICVITATLTQLTAPLGPR